MIYMIAQLGRVSFTLSSGVINVAKDGQRGEIYKQA